METIIKGIKRPMIINDIEVEDVNDIVSKLNDGELIRIKLNGIKVQSEQAAPSVCREVVPASIRVNHTYLIKVQQYMTKPATEDFDFQLKWNNNVPMPFRIMKGRVLKETRGMVMMDCCVVPLKTDICMRCGRPLTHPVSRLYGIGPECGEHAYINPFNTEEELYSALDDVKRKLSNVRWRGWIIKSAIEECQEVRG